MSSSKGIKVLVVDDEPSICWGLEKLLRGEGLHVWTAGSAEAGLQLAQQHRPAFLLLDVRLPGESGLDALPKFLAATRGAPVIVMTAFGDLDTAVSAVRQGACDYLTKPFSLDAAWQACKRALRRSRAWQEDVPPGTPQTNKASSAVVSHFPAAGNWTQQPDHSARKSVRHVTPLVGRSAAMQQVFRQIAIFADSELSVLITGETGTGKELVAAAIHQHSRRRKHPYVAIAPVALSPALLESELFGHVRGAFTGAVEHRQGIFESAAQGTILLDEIGDLSLAAQVKLLRVLEQRQFIPVGAVTPRDCNVRILAATHRDLQAAVIAGNFREDLLYRLAAVKIELPPLRERPEDIPFLAEQFLCHLGYPSPATAISASLLRHLAQQPWPGNIRQLRNAIEHAAVIARGRPLDIGDFSQLDTAPESEQNANLETAVQRWVGRAMAERTAAAHKGADANPHAQQIDSLYEQFLAAAEPALLQTVLDATQGNRAAAAQRLGLHRTTLRERLKRYGL